MTQDGQLLSTQQVAKAVGVSVTTIKRWVDDGILPAHRTAGGHRKLVLADVLRLTRESGLPQADLGQLVPATRHEPADPHAYYLQLLDAIREIEDQRIRSVISAAYRAGIPVEQLADNIIAPVMHFVGQQWQHDKLDVGTEHLVTQSIVAGLYELQGQISANASENPPVALGGAPQSDYYIVPSLLAKLTLLEAGWNALNIGPNTPASAFLNRMEAHRPKLIWLSVSHMENEAAFEADYTPVLLEARRLGIPVALGGRALSAELRARLPYTTFGDGFTQLADFARTLIPPPKRPRRGRPPQSENS